jgi:hypothetical protein
MSNWIFAQSLVGTGDKLVTLTAGSGGVVPGDPLKSNGTGGWIKTSAATDVPKYVAAAAAVSSAPVVAVPCIPTNVFRVPFSGTMHVGKQCDLTITTNVINGAGVTTKAVECVGLDEDDATIGYFISRGWLA